MGAPVQYTFTALSFGVLLAYTRWTACEYGGKRFREVEGYAMRLKPVQAVRAGERGQM